MHIAVIEHKSLPLPHTLSHQAYTSAAYGVRKLSMRPKKNKSYNLISQPFPYHGEKWSFLKEQHNIFYFGNYLAFGSL